jgi:hypothetical protein
MNHATTAATTPRQALPDYVTIVAQARANVPGFDQLYKDLERSISISGKSASTLTNYGRQLAHLALHYQTLPTDLDTEGVMDCLHLVKSRGSVSAEPEGLPGVREGGDDTGDGLQPARPAT